MKKNVYSQKIAYFRQSNFHSQNLQFRIYIFFLSIDFIRHGLPHTGITTMCFIALIH